MILTICLKHFSGLTPQSAFHSLFSLRRSLISSTREFPFSCQPSAKKGRSAFALHTTHAFVMPQCTAARFPDLHEGNFSTLCKVESQCRALYGCLSDSCFRPSHCWFSRGPCLVILPGLRSFLFFLSLTADLSGDLLALVCLICSCPFGVWLFGGIQTIGTCDTSILLCLAETKGVNIAAAAVPAGP